MNPVVVHVVRPYVTEQDYLAAEAWSIDARGMLLIDAEPLPVDTAVLFDVALEDGHKPIRAEGRVVSVVAEQGERPGGLRVKFRRFGAATKAFIERAVKQKTASAEAERPSQPGAERPSSVDGDRVSVVEVERPSSVDGDRVSVVEVERPSLPEVRASMSDETAPERGSGVNQRRPGPVIAPANRDELLARLRSRQKAG